MISSTIVETDKNEDSGDQHQDSGDYLQKSGVQLQDSGDQLEEEELQNELESLVEESQATTSDETGLNSSLYSGQTSCFKLLQKYVLAGYKQVLFHIQQISLRLNTFIWFNMFLHNKQVLCIGINRFVNIERRICRHE